MLTKIYGLDAPSFDDYISDLAVMLDMYPTKCDQQLHEVREAMALIDDLAAVADKLPELPREKEVKDDTGESVDEVEKKEQHKVIDLQRKEN